LSAQLFGQTPTGQSVSLLVKGTNFQVKVWEALLRTPMGHVTSYGDLAAASGSPGASRAVGTAMACNQLAVLIPCHRVIRENGVIGQYRWGSERKSALLLWEHVQRFGA
jgi:AraC family transcriptional regulator of adaptative response/methylated-DNA-[protein]-cysteine methyltransferase